MKRYPAYLLWIFFASFLFTGTLYSQVAPAPDFSCHVTVDLLNVTPDKDRVKVTITPPPVQSRIVKLIMPDYLPGVPGHVEAARFIHQFYALDDKGFPLKAKKKGNVIIMKLRKGSTLKKIEYWVDDTWDAEKPKPNMSDEKFNYVPQRAGTNFEANSSFVLNHAFLFGYIEGFANVPYIVTVVKPPDMVASTSFPVKNLTRTRDEYSAPGYAALVDTPVMYCVPDTAGFLSGNIYVTISVFSENGKISARLVRRLIAAQIAASTNFIPELEPRRYKLLFYFTTPFRTVLNIHGAYGGLAHRNSAFYFLPELPDQDALANELQRETSGDLLHLLAPLDYRVTCGSENFLRPQLTPEWWFSEGTGLYFGWLAAVRDSFASESEFMGAVSARIRRSQFVPHHPISDVSMIRAMEKDPLKREAIRSKAMLTAFLLDIFITENTGGNMGLREVVVRLQQGGHFFRDSLETQLAAIAGPSIHTFFDNYVNGSRPLPLISYLAKIGWAYAPETIDSVLTFGRFGLVYDDERDVFFVHNADTTNRFGLRNGDRIVSVDNVIVSAMNFDEVLAPIYSPRSRDAVEVRYIRGEQNVVARASPVAQATLVEHLIRTDPAAGEEAVLLHNRIISPPPEMSTE